MKAKKWNDGSDDMNGKLSNHQYFLSPFYVASEQEMTVNEISVEKKDGGIAVSILIVSGASDSVAPPGMFPDIPIIKTNLSEGGLMYTAAGGEQIPNQGMQRPVVYTPDGTRHMMTFQVAGVHKALGAVSRIVGTGHRVIFDDPNIVGSYIENKQTGKKTMLRQHNGVYFLDVYMKPGEHVPVQGFPRRAS